MLSILLAFISTKAQQKYIKFPSHTSNLKQAAKSADLTGINITTITKRNSKQW